MCTQVYGIIYAKPLGKGGAIYFFIFGLLITSYDFETLYHLNFLITKLTLMG